MLINCETLKRDDYWRILQFQTIEALYQAILIYDAVEPTMPKDILERLTSELTQTGLWEFHSRPCTLNAKRAADGLYYLEVVSDSAGPGGSEKYLNRETGTPIGYAACEIKRTWQSEQARFSIPLSDIEAVYTAAGAKFDLEKFSTDLLKPTYRKDAPALIHYFASPTTLISDDEIEMSIKLTSLIDPARDQRSETEGQSRDYRYAIEDRCLTGPTFWMGESAWGNNGISPGYLPIGMAISIRPTNSPIADARMTPTFDPAIQARICALADKIEAAWITPAIAAQRKQTAEFQERFSSSLERLQKRDLRHRKWCGIFRRILGL